MARKSTGRKSRSAKPLNLVATAIDWGEPPRQIALPSIQELRALSIKQLNDHMERFGVMKPSKQAIAENVGYLERMTSIQPGTKEFATALNTLTNSSEKRAALGASRRAYRQSGILEAVAKKPGQQFIRLSETDDHTCDSCYSKAGEMGTIKEHAEIGLPGPASCYGGDYCRCTLVLVD